MLNAFKHRLLSHFPTISTSLLNPMTLLGCTLISSGKKETTIEIAFFFEEYCELEKIILWKSHKVFTFPLHDARHAITLQCQDHKVLHIFASSRERERILTTTGANKLSQGNWSHVLSYALWVTEFFTGLFPLQKHAKQHIAVLELKDIFMYVVSYSEGKILNVNKKSLGWAVLNSGSSWKSSLGHYERKSFTFSDNSEVEWEIELECLNSKIKWSETIFLFSKQQMPKIAFGGKRKRRQGTEGEN